jgi:hypothetical protein
LGARSVDEADTSAMAGFGVERVCSAVGFRAGDSGRIPGAWLAGGAMEPGRNDIGGARGAKQGVDAGRGKQGRAWSNARRGGEGKFVARAAKPCGTASVAGTAVH